MTEEQCEKFAYAYSKQKSGLIPLPSGNMIDHFDISYVGSINEAPPVEDKNYIPAGQKALPAPAHEDIGYLQILTNGEVPTGSKEFKINVKKMWFEHVKRRPMLNKLAKEKREAAWSHHVSRFSPEEQAIMQMPRGYLEPDYSKEESKIINTPIEILMETFDKTLT